MAHAETSAIEMNKYNTIIMSNPLWIIVALYNIRIKKSTVYFEIDCLLAGIY